MLNRKTPYPPQSFLNGESNRSKFKGLLNHKRPYSSLPKEMIEYQNLKKN